MSRHATLQLSLDKHAIQQLNARMQIAVPGLQPIHGGDFCVPNQSMNPGIQGAPAYHGIAVQYTQAETTAAVNLHTACLITVANPVWAAIAQDPSALGRYKSHMANILLSGEQPAGLNRTEEAEVRREMEKQRSTFNKCFEYLATVIVYCTANFYIPNSEWSQLCQASRRYYEACKAQPIPLDVNHPTRAAVDQACYDIVQILGDSNYTNSVRPAILLDHLELTQVMRELLNHQRWGKKPYNKYNYKKQGAWYKKKNWNKKSK